MQIVRVRDKTADYIKRHASDIGNKLGSKITVKDETVSIDGLGNEEERTLQEFLGQKVIKALDGGLKLEDAAKLMNEEYAMKVIDLKEMGYAQGVINRHIGRVIGEDGRAKRMLEKSADVKIGVTEHQIAVLGKFEDVDIAIEAIMRLVSGSPHKNVYRYIDEGMARLERKEAEEEFGD